LALLFPCENRSSTNGFENHRQSGHIFVLSSKASEIEFESFAAVVVESRTKFVCPTFDRLFRPPREISLTQTVLYK
jgi:hypothetical protein